MKKNKRAQFYKNTVFNVKKIIEVLKKNDNEFLTISRIATLTKIHKWSVSRTIDLYLRDFVEILSPPELREIGMSVKFVRLKNPEVKTGDVIKFLIYKKTLK